MKHWIRQFLKLGTLISTYGFILSVLLQIFARLFLPAAPAWTEEASRIFFIYSMAFSAGLALESKEYVALEWLFNRLPTMAQRYLKIIISFSILGLFTILLVYAIIFTINGHDEFSPGLKIRMSWVFSSMVIMGLNLTYHAFDQLIQEAKILIK